MAIAGRISFDKVEVLPLPSKYDTGDYTVCDNPPSYPWLTDGMMAVLMGTERVNKR